MNDADIVRQALNIKAQEMGTYAGDTVMDALSQMWDGVDGPMAVLRKWGLDPEKEQQFWNDFEDLLDNLKNTMPGVAVSAKKRAQEEKEISSESGIQVDKFQGYTEEGKKFGYIAGDGGGWFFTYNDTLDDTLDSLEIDEVDGDGGISYKEAYAALSQALFEA